MNINSKHARSYQVACEEGSIRGASERLEIEPSSVSRQIKNLEESLAIELIERSRNGVQPTVAGKILLRYLRHQSSELEAILSEFDALRGMRKGEIVVALGDGFVNDFVTNALQHFKQLYPGFHFVIQNGSTEQILHSIKTDQAHLGFVFNAQADASIECLAEHTQALELLLNPNSQWSKTGAPVSIETLLKLPFAVLSNDFGVGKMLHQFQHQNSIRLNNVIDTNSLQTLKNVVLENLGVSALPAFVVTREIEAKKILALPIDAPALHSGKVAIVTRKNRTLTKGVESLIKVAKERMVAFQ